MSGSGGRAPTPIRVAVVDDHEVVLRGLLGLSVAAPAAREADQTLDGVEVVAVATSVPELLGQVDGQDLLDVVLLDLHLADGSAPGENTAALVARGWRVVVLTSDLRPVPIRAAIGAGAVGLVLKSDPLRSLVATVRDVHENGDGFSSDLAHVLVTDPALVTDLAPREVEALRLLASGVPRKLVHRHMEPPVSAHTAETYFKRVAERFAKGGRPTTSALHAAQEASRQGHW